MWREFTGMRTSRFSVISIDPANPTQLAAMNSQYLHACTFVSWCNLWKRLGWAKAFLQCALLLLS
jgi:hypothetical protein